MKKVLIIYCLLVSNLLFGQEKILFTNAFLHVGNGESMPSATVGIEKGKITLIQNSLTYNPIEKDWDTIINLNGGHMYPGFIAPNSTLGLTEIDAVRATNDFNEVGLINPHVRSQIAFNVESKVLSTVKTNGVLLSQPTPRGGLISGTSSVMANEGWNWEDATLLKDDGIHVNWPSAYFNTDNKENPLENYQKKVKALETFFQMAKNDSELKTASGDLRLKAMHECFKGTKRVYFHANLRQEILDIISFSKTFGLTFPVIIGGDEAYMVSNRLKDANIPIMLNRIHNLPKSEDSPVNEPYTLPYLFQQKGILFCIQNEGDMEAMQARNLPFLAGTAQAYGLTEEQAVMALTLNTAKILGIDKQYGSIEIGKSATFFVSRGNALDVISNDVFLAMINGQWLNLNNSQKELYEKYTKKYKDSGTINK
jgi:hypothetical protein